MESADETSSRGAGLFRICGITLVVLSCVFAVISRGFAYGTLSEGRPFPALAIVTAVAFFVYFLAVCQYRKRGGNGIRAREVLGFAILMRLPLLVFSEPVQEIDFYRYLWDGRVVVEGVSPYRHSPESLDAYLRDFSVGHVDDPSIPPDVERLLAVLERSGPVRESFSRIDHRSVTTIYPPVAQAVFAAAASVTPESATPRVHLLVLRSMLTVFDIGVVAALLLILRRLRLPVVLAISYAWCPLVLKEIANGSHMDAIAVFFTAASFLGFLAAGRSIKPGWPLLVAWIMLALAIYAKWYPIILVPAFAVFSLRRWKWPGLAAMVPACVLSMLGLALMARLTIQEDPSSPARPTSGVVMTGEKDGLRAFLSRWEMNDLIFSVVRENLRAPTTGEGARAEPWYALTPDAVREAWAGLVSRVGLSGPEMAPDFTGARVVCGALLGVVILLQCGRLLLAERIGAAELGRSLFLVLAASWYLSATQNPWYWIWALPFLEFARSRTWTLVSGFAFLYYARFWFIYEFPDTFLGEYSGQRFFDEVIVWFEHLPVLGLLLWERLRSFSKADESFGE